MVWTIMSIILCMICPRYGLAPESPALTRWRTGSPLLVLGSHDWNMPGADGGLKCGGAEQARLFAAAKAGRWAEARLVHMRCDPYNGSYRELGRKRCSVRHCSWIS